MEVRHLRKLANNEKLSQTPRVLLGTYLPVPIPHLHDPYMLNEQYLRTCLNRVEKAVIGLCEAFPAETSLQEPA